MDPFYDVLGDAKAQLETLRGLAARAVTANAQLDFDNTHLEIEETLDDLRLSVEVSQTTPEQFNLTQRDIGERERIVAQLRRDLDGVVAAWRQRCVDPRRQREVTTMANRILQDGDSSGGGGGGGAAPATQRNDEFEQFQQQQATQEQDLQLDSIHHTMRNLNQQAMLMGQELQDQGYMLDDLDQEIDVVGGKLQRGLKRVNYVLEKNRERASDCCIALLVVALCILLVLLIVA